MRIYIYIIDEDEERKKQRVEHLKRIYIGSYTLITFMLVITYNMMITTCVHELQFF